MSKFKKIIKKNSEKLLIKSFLKYFIQIALKKERLKKRFSFVLTGGPTPINLYKKMSKLKIDWDNIDLFWGDERFVPKKSKNSNYQLVHKHLLKKIKINNKQIYFINTKNKSAQLSAKNYEKKLIAYFKKNKIVFDLILLGMGNDGHIASIFTEDLNNNSKKIVKSVIRKDFRRITLSLNTINKAKSIFLWLNSKKQTKKFKLYERNKKNVPAYLLKKKKTIIFTIDSNNI